MQWSPISYVVSRLSNPIEFIVTPNSQTFTPPIFLIQGCVAALVHHFLITVALGSDIASSLICWALSNAVYILSAGPKNILTFLQGLLLFNAIYVGLCLFWCLSVACLCLPPQSDLQCLFASPWYSNAMGVQLV